MPSQSVVVRLETGQAISPESIVVTPVEPIETVTVLETKPVTTTTIIPAKSRSAQAWRETLQTILLPLCTFTLVIMLWAVIQQRYAPELPTPLQTWQQAVTIFSNPFYDQGPNDKGIGWQILFSLGRVSMGFGLALLVGIPLGFLLGMSKNFSRALQPLIAILRPVSPLAWLPIGLLLFKAATPSAIFVIFITSIWPLILNTAAGVRAIPQDYMNVAAVLRLGSLEIAYRILLPAAMPYIITGMRLSLSIAWMVIVAAEMLTGGIGIGFYVWDQWNNLNVASIIVAIGVIGIVGITLELVMNALQYHFDYTRV